MDEAPPFAGPPWLDPDLLPEATQGGAWAWISRGVAHPMTLEELLGELRLDPDRPAPRASPFTLSAPTPPMVAIVESPWSPRMLPVSEAPELQPALLARDEVILARSLRSGLPVLAGTGMLLAAGIALHGPLPLLVLLGLFFLMRLGPTVDEALLLRRIRGRPESYLLQHARELRFQVWMGKVGATPVRRTWTLAGAWTALFLLQVTTGGDHSILAAGLVKAKVAAEPWRLLTATMLHGSPLHLVMNAIAGLLLGKLTERVVSRHLVAPVWLLSALAGSLASWALVDITSIGASGGLMGLLGFLGVVGWRRRQLLPPDFGGAMARSVALMAVLGILGWKLVDNAGHAGGLLAGGLVGLWIFRGDAPLPLPERRDWAALGWGAMAAFLALAAWTTWVLLKG